MMFRSRRNGGSPAKYWMESAVRVRVFGAAVVALYWLKRSCGSRPDLREASPQWPSLKRLPWVVE